MNEQAQRLKSMIVAKQLRKVVVYYSEGNDESGQPLPVHRYELDPIDALHALESHAHQYSIDAPAKGVKVIDKTPRALEIKPELLPDEGSTYASAQRLRDGSLPIARPSWSKADILNEKRGSDG